MGHYKQRIQEVGWRETLQVQFPYAYQEINEMSASTLRKLQERLDLLCHYDVLYVQSMSDSEAAKHQQYFKKRGGKGQEIRSPSDLQQQRAQEDQRTGE
jgi:hypothetical protein